MTEADHKTAEAEEMRAWPATLQRLVAIIGKEKTIALASTYGGLDRIHIPHTTSTTHMWRSVLGDDAWKAVIENMGGERIDLPRGVFLSVKKWAILDLAADGLPHRQIALRVRCSERYVRSVLQGQPKAEDSRQVKLFE